MATFGEIIGELIHSKRLSSGMSQLDLSLEAFENPTKVRRIVELENGQVDKPQAKTLKPICETLNISDADIRKCKRQASDSSAQNDSDIEALRHEVGSLGKALEDLRRLSRDQLETLAIRFLISDPHLLENSELRVQLEDKAADYRALKAQIASLDERVSAVANLKGAAQDAVERMDFEEVEETLRRVDEVESEIVSETKISRAKNALMRGKTEQAFELYSSAADTFLSVDRLEPTRRRLLYEDELFQHGRRYGSNGISLSEKMVRDALMSLNNKDHPILWGRAMNALGTALSTLGERSSSKKAKKLFEDAIKIFKESLSTRTRDQHPLQWAATTQNIANSYRHLAKLVLRGDGDRYLTRAITNYEVAKEVFDPAANPKDRAITSRNLGNTLREKGVVLSDISSLSQFENSKRAFDEALDFFNEKDHPFHWADTCFGRAQLEMLWAKNPFCNNVEEHAGKSLLYIEMALTVFTPERSPYNNKQALELYKSIQSLELL